MATQREKVLTITLLKERLERLSGKKVVITEDSVDAYPGYTSDTTNFSGKKSAAPAVAAVEPVAATSEPQIPFSKSRKGQFKNGLYMLLDKKMTALQAYKWLMNEGYKESMGGDLEDLVDEYNDERGTSNRVGYEIGFGSGEIENTLQNLGYRLSPQDISSMKIDDIGPGQSGSIDQPTIIDLAFNIFYNTAGNGLYKFADKNVVNAMVQALSGYKDSEELFQFDPSQRGLEFSKLLKVIKK